MNVPSGYSALDLVGFTDKGDYSPSETYVKNDLVHYNDKIWKCLIDDTTGIVPTTGVNWDIWIDQSNSLDGLADVEITNPTDGQELSYDATTQKWKNTSKIQSLTNEVKGHWSEGGKNLLPFTLEYAISKNKNGTWSGNKYNIKGITFTINDDGSVTVNGTHDGTSGIATLNLFKETNWEHEVVIINGAPSGSAQNYCAIEVSNQGSSTRIGYVSETNPEIEIPTSVTNIGIYIHVWGGQTVNNLTFYPMIRLASIEDDTYEPYAKTNQQLTEDTTSLLDNTEVNGAVNMLPNNATTQTINGITFTVNDDGTVTADGTATERTRFYFLEATGGTRYSLKRNYLGTLLLSGCPNGGGDDSYKLIVQTSDSVTGSFMHSYEDIGDGIIIPSSTTELYFKAYILIVKNITVSNLTFKPMITVPSYNGDYVPYAKSNRELTEDVESIEGDINDLRHGILGLVDNNIDANTETTIINSRGVYLIFATSTVVEKLGVFFAVIHGTGASSSHVVPIYEGTQGMITFNTSEAGVLKVTSTQGIRLRVLTISTSANY